MSIQSYNRIKIMNRFKLGIQQLWYYPITNLFWLIPIFSVILLSFLTKKIDSLLHRFPIIMDIVHILMIVLIVTILFSMAIGIPFVIGELYARKDETKIALAFSRNSHIGNYPPFLISKKRIMKTKIIEREFYSIIPLKEWINNEDAICDLLDIHVIGDIHYGGKNNDTGYIISFRSSKGRFASERGVIEDEEF